MGGGPTLPSFSPAVAYGAGQYPLAIAAGDFNGDGNLDLVATNNNASTVSLLIGNGNGTFGAATSFAGQNSAQWIAAADLNGDKVADVIEANGGQLAWMLAKGDGTLLTPQTYGVTANNFPQPAVADFNGDGRPDVAVGGGCQGIGCQNTVTTFLATGNGSLQFKTTIQVAGTNLLGLAAGDFDGDGRIDLVASDDQTLRATFLPGSGDGNFAAANGGGGLSNATAGTLAAADLNADKKVDLIAYSFLLGVSLGKGDGSLQAQTLYPANGNGSGFRPLAVEDLNGDGHLDIVAGSSPSVIILVGAGDGTFPVSMNVLAGQFAGTIALGDFNGDGKPDLAVCDQQVVNVLLNQTP
jgi:hypothetical protein